MADLQKRLDAIELKEEKERVGDKKLTLQIQQEIVKITELSSPEIARKLDVSYDTAFYILTKFLDPIARDQKKPVPYKGSF